MNRIQTTHVGSIVRPAWLREDLIAIARGEPYDHERYQARLAVAVAVADVVKAQAEVGLDVVNDGEYTKLGYLTSIYDRVSGIEARTRVYDPQEVRGLLPPELKAQVAERTLSGVDPEIAGSIDLSHELFRFANFAATTMGKSYEAGDDGLGWHCTGPIVYDPRELAQHLALFTEALEGVKVAGAFVGSLSPASVYYMTDEYYRDEREFIFAISAALREEYRQIIDAGFDLHIDDPVMWHKYSTIQMAGETAADYADWANLRIEALNAALEGIPLERIRYHVCSSSSHSAKVFDPTLSEILPFILGIKWGKLLFEQGNVRHEHEWEIWRDVPLPEDRVLVPGVITHHTHMAEHPDLVAQRLVRLANIVGRERVMAGADCGFAQSAWIARAEPWVQWEKFRALAEGARRASDQLWKS